MTRPGPAARSRRPGAGEVGHPDRIRTQRPGPRPSGGGPRRTPPTARGGRRAPAREPFAPPYRIVELRSPDGPLRARVDPRPEHPHRAPGSPLRRFVRTWGWRAYALPILTVLTVLCGVDVANGAEAGMPLIGSDPKPSPPAAAPVAPPVVATTAAPKPTPTSSGIFVDDGGSGTARPLPPTALPAGAAFAQRGTGVYTILRGNSKVYGTGPLHRFTVEVEGGVTENASAFAAAVERTLSDEHSWGHGGRASFQRVDSGEIDFRVSLTASLSVRTLCGYDLPYETSCYNGDKARVVINDARWVRGAVAYGGNLAQYRLYVVNHEVGHALGNNHVGCPKKDALAPIMMQQTLGISTAGVGACKPNPWPYP
ncbi:MAG TPA: DUF3152 domain-containing protein [Mycobacteriales bacterium]|nr:DUF3152 domain-containing protein [Mycobacteriales bacterium]